jgi:Ca-activated chloride channel family protein
MRKLIQLAVGVCFFAAVMSTSGRAQDEEKVTVSANLVSVNVSVTDSRGKHVEGLAAGQFEVFDDGVRQRVAHFSAGDAPFSLGIVYDMHPSTRERAAAVLGALKRFTGGLRRDDDFFLLVFNERGSATVEFVPTAEQIGEHLTFIPPKEPNSLYDAVYLAAEKMRSRPRAKKALLVISDGLDHGSRHGYTELRRRVGEFDLQLYGIGINGPRASGWVFEDLTRPTGRRMLPESADSAAGQAALDQMARASGGAAYSPQAESERELFRICEQVKLEMRRQYTVGFYPAGASGKTRWHKLRVRVTPPGGASRLRLSYREGYRPRAD